MASNLICVFCGARAQGNYSIHRDGFGVGPEVDLCNNCGQDVSPSCCDIWETVAKPSTEPFAYRITRHEA
jgi:hypothetical protein